MVVALADGARGVFGFVVLFDQHRCIDFRLLHAIADGVGVDDGTFANLATRRQPEWDNDSPPRVRYSSTELKLWRHIGQLLARSTQGLRHSSWRSWPQGRRWAIRSELGVDDVDLVVELSGTSVGGPGSLAELSSRVGGCKGGKDASRPRSPKQTMQVFSDMASEGAIHAHKSVEECFIEL